MQAGTDAWARERKQAESLGWGFTLLETIDPRAAGLIPLHFQQENGLLAFGTSELDGLDLLLVAVDGPEREDVIDELRFQMQRAVKLFLCPPAVLRDGWALVAAGKGRGAAPASSPPTAPAPTASPSPVPADAGTSPPSDEEEELELLLEPEMIVEESAPMAELIPEPSAPPVSDGWSDELEAIPAAVVPTRSIPLPGNIPSRPASSPPVASATASVSASGGAEGAIQDPGVPLGRVALHSGGTAKWNAVAVPEASDRGAPGAESSGASHASPAPPPQQGSLSGGWSPVLPPARGETPVPSQGPSAVDGWSPVTSSRVGRSFELDARTVLPETSSTPRPPVVERDVTSEPAPSERAVRSTPAPLPSALPESGMTAEAAPPPPVESHTPAPQPSAAPESGGVADVAAITPATVETPAPQSGQVAEAALDAGATRVEAGSARMQTPSPAGKDAHAAPAPLTLTPAPQTVAAAADGQVTDAAPLAPGGDVAAVPDFLVLADPASGALASVSDNDLVDTDWAEELLPDGPPPPPPDAEPGIALQPPPPENAPDSGGLADEGAEVIDTDWAKEFLPDGPPPPPESVEEGGPAAHDPFGWGLTNPGTEGATGAGEGPGGGMAAAPISRTPEPAGVERSPERDTDRPSTFGSGMPAQTAAGVPAPVDAGGDLPSAEGEASKDASVAAPKGGGQEAGGEADRPEVASATPSDQAGDPTADALDDPSAASVGEGQEPGPSEVRPPSDRDPQQVAHDTDTDKDLEGSAASETVDTDWAEELLPEGPPPPPETDEVKGRPDGLRALAEGSSGQRFGFSPEELAILDGLERLASGIDEEASAEKVRPARMIASVVRLLLRKGLIDERELLDELSRG